MNAPVLTLPTRGFRPLMLGSQSNPDLWARLGECDRRCSALMTEQDSHDFRTGYYAAISAELDAWRDEQTRVETELKQRFLSWCGGVSMTEFMGRLA